jgi:hypothetical protein
MFLLFTFIQFWVWGILQKWFVCAPTAYEVVGDCRKFEENWYRCSQNKVQAEELQRHGYVASSLSAP